MKVTLKLTNEEFAVLKNENLSHREIALPFTYIGKGGFTSKGINVLDVDKFREFLNDEIKSLLKYKESGRGLDRIKSNYLKSILSKLDDAVIKSLKDEISKEFNKNFPEGQKIDDLQNAIYTIEGKAVVHNNEPKFIDFLKVAYYKGSLRQDIVIDINDFPTYLEKQKNREIHIVGVSLHHNDVYISEIKDAVQNDEPFKCDDCKRCDGSGKSRSQDLQTDYCEDCDGSGIAK